MSTSQEKAAAAADHISKQNPSNSPERPQAEMKRIPLSVPVLKLQVPEIPGFHLHWFRGTSARVQQAQRAGYVFVHPSEVQLNDVAIGGDGKRGGNTDLGDRVSVVAGDMDDQGQAIRLYLMKQPMEMHLEDDKILQDRNASVADALTAAYRNGMVGGAAPGEGADDLAARYVNPTRSRVPDLFRRKTKK